MAILMKGILYNDVVILDEGEDKGTIAREPLPNMEIRFYEKTPEGGFDYENERAYALTNEKGEYEFEIERGKYYVVTNPRFDRAKVFPLNLSSFLVNAESHEGSFQEFLYSAEASDVDDELLKKYEDAIKRFNDAVADGKVVLDSSIASAKKEADRSKAEADRAESSLSKKRDLTDNKFNGRLTLLHSASTNIEFFRIFGDAGSVGLWNISDDGRQGWHTYGDDGAWVHWNWLPEKGGQLAILNDIPKMVVDSNGFMKASSPIIQLFSDRIEKNDANFGGEPTFERLDLGVYTITGTLGLAQEGWYIEVPKDRNGLPLVMIEWKQDEENNVTIHTFERKFDLEKADFVNGEPKDIPIDRWIDLRFVELEVEEEEHIEEYQNDLAH